jgi:hypothetical protein
MRFAMSGLLQFVQAFSEHLYTKKNGCCTDGCQASFDVSVITGPGVLIGGADVRECGVN